MAASAWTTPILRPWLDPLAEGMTLTFLDFRANGRSTGAGDGLTMQRLADDVEALREHLGAERMWLLGQLTAGSWRSSTP